MIREMKDEFAGKPVTADELAMLRDLAANSTIVVGWYTHSDGGYNGEATVRGPFCRWLVQEVAPEYKKHVAYGYDDAKFVSAAMNYLVPLLDEIDRLKAQLNIASLASEDK